MGATTTTIVATLTLLSEQAAALDLAEATLLASEAEVLAALLPPAGVRRLVDRVLTLAYDAAATPESTRTVRGIALCGDLIRIKSGDLDPTEIRWVNGQERNRGAYKVEVALVLRRDGHLVEYKSGGGSWSRWQGESCEWTTTATDYGEGEAGVRAALADGWQADGIVDGLAEAYARGSEAAATKATVLATRQARVNLALAALAAKGVE